MISVRARVIRSPQHLATSALQQQEQTRLVETIFMTPWRAWASMIRWVVTDFTIPTLAAVFMIHTLEAVIRM